MKLFLKSSVQKELNGFSILNDFSIVNNFSILSVEPNNVLSRDIYRSLSKKPIVKDQDFKVISRISTEKTSSFKTPQFHYIQQVLFKSDTSFSTIVVKYSTKASEFEITLVLQQEPSLANGLIAASRITAPNSSPIAFVGAIFVSLVQISQGFQYHTQDEFCRCSFGYNDPNDPNSVKQEVKTIKDNPTITKLPLHNTPQDPSDKDKLKPQLFNGHDIDGCTNIHDKIYCQ